MGRPEQGLRGLQGLTIPSCWALLRSHAERVAQTCLLICHCARLQLDRRLAGNRAPLGMFFHAGGVERMLAGLLQWFGRVALYLLTTSVPCPQHRHLPYRQCMRLLHCTCACSTPWPHTARLLPCSLWLLQGCSRRSRGCRTCASSLSMLRAFPTSGL